MRVGPAVPRPGTSRHFSFVVESEKHDFRNPQQVIRERMRKPRSKKLCVDYFVFVFLAALLPLPDVKSNSLPSSLFELNQLLLTANAASLPQCLALLNQTSNCASSAQAAEPGADLVDTLERSLQNARIAESVDCPHALTQRCTQEDGGEQCCVNESRPGCEGKNFTKLLEELRRQVLAVSMSESCRSLSAAHNACFTASSLADCSATTSHFAAQSRELVRNFTGCLNSTSELEDGESMNAHNVFVF